MSQTKMRKGMVALTLLHVVIWTALIVGYDKLKSVGPLDDISVTELLSMMFIISNGFLIAASLERR